jgi:hypothetical protein
MIGSTLPRGHPLGLSVYVDLSQAEDSAFADLELVVDKPPVCANGGRCRHPQDNHFRRYGTTRCEICTIEGGGCR